MYTKNFKIIVKTQTMRKITEITQAHCRINKITKYVMKQVI